MTAIALKAEADDVREVPTASEWFEGSASRVVRTYVVDRDADVDRIGSEIGFGFGALTWVGRPTKSHPMVVSIAEPEQTDRLLDGIAILLSFRASLISFAIAVTVSTFAVWQIWNRFYLPVFATITTAFFFGCIGVTQFVVGKGIARIKACQRDKWHS